MNFLLPLYYIFQTLDIMCITAMALHKSTVPPGWIVTGYNNDNFKGDSVIIKNDTRCIGNLNNRISSLKIKENTNLIGLK
jgi:hypothetical protein